MNQMTEREIGRVPRELISATIIQDPNIFDQIRNGSKVMKVKFKGQTVKPYVMFHAGRKMTSWFSLSLSLRERESVTLIEPVLQPGQSCTVAGVASSRLSRLAKRQLGGVRWAYRRHPAMCARLRGFASNRVRLAQQQPCAACQCQRGARRAVHATRQGVPQPQGDSRRRRQRCREVSLQSHILSARFQATGRPTVSRLA